jgi:DNA-binding CsgD family transcriptional regulator
MLKKIVLSLALLFLFIQNSISQSGIRGKLIIDTAVWAPVAYLSLIPDFDNMFTMSNEMIIDKSNIDDSGNFAFNTQYLPNDDVLIRFHVSKKGDLPASLIIGGKDENHFFFIANRNSIITIKDTGNSEFIKDIALYGYFPNKTLQQVDRIANYLDTTSNNNSLIKTELIRSAVFEKLRSIADTCSNPLVSLYALYKSKFDKNYSVNQLFYRNFLFKWRKVKNPYFQEFRNKLPEANNNEILSSAVLALISLTIGFLMYFGYTKVFKKKQNPLQDLSVQERKIFALLLEGKSNKEISETLMISLSTAKSHVNNIYSKLGINSRKDVLNLNLENKSSGT